MAQTDLLNNLQAYADNMIKEHNIPAVSLAIWNNDELQQAAAGILNLNTGVTATTDSIFQIGSITKVMTTCLVMQLVDEGRIELDKPVKHYLRDFQIADSEATESITVRQCLNHTNGIAGDFFPDDHGHEGNLIARYVDRCNLLPLIHPVGQMYSYSNSAFGIIGRLVEVVRGTSWYEAMRESIFEPLGMEHAIADPIDVIRYRAAMGHIFDGDNTDRWVLPKQPYLTLGLAPVGSTPAMSAADLITFARAHLEGGLSQSGKRWLSPESISAMQASQIKLPPFSQLSHKHAGLGWGLIDYHASNTRVVSHAGATKGFLSMLQLIPETNSAFAILMNGFKPTAFEAINRDLMAAVAGIECQEPDLEQRPVDLDDLKRYVGRYESMDTLIEVRSQDRTLMATVVYKIDPLPPQTLALKQVEGGCFATFTEDGKRSQNLVFVEENAEGVPAYLFASSRLNNRIQ